MQFDEVVQWPTLLIILQDPMYTRSLIDDNLVNICGSQSRSHLFFNLLDLCLNLTRVALTSVQVLLDELQNEPLWTIQLSSALQKEQCVL